jgi:hypothetical protein
MHCRVTVSMSAPSRCADVKAQPKPPSFTGIGQPNQKIGNPHILVAQKRAEAIAGLADTKSPAGQRDADTAPLHRCCGHLSALTQGKCAQLPSGQWMAHLLFSKGFLQQISPHAQLRKHPLQPAVLVRRGTRTDGVCASLHGLRLADHGRIYYPAEFCRAKAREGMPPYLTRHL